jgi:hypothetical protein
MSRAMAGKRDGNLSSENPVHGTAMDSRERSASANLSCEEPSALDAHARFCGGRGSVTPSPTRPGGRPCRGPRTSRRRRRDRQRPRRAGRSRAAAGRPRSAGARPRPGSRAGTPPQPIRTCPEFIRDSGHSREKRLTFITEATAIESAGGGVGEAVALVGAGAGIGQGGGDLAESVEERLKDGNGGHTLCLKALSEKSSPQKLVPHSGSCGGKKPKIGGNLELLRKRGLCAAVRML